MVPLFSQQRQFWGERERERTYNIVRAFRPRIARHLLAIAGVRGVGFWYTAVLFRPMVEKWCHVYLA